jgi:hypothetical protein
MPRDVNGNKTTLTHGHVNLSGATEYNCYNEVAEISHTPPAMTILYSHPLQIHTIIN